MVQDTGRQMSSSALGPALPEEQQKGRHEDSFPVKQGSVRSKNTEREAQLLVGTFSPWGPLPHQLLCDYVRNIK